MVKFGYMTNPTRDVLKEIGFAVSGGFDFVEIGMEGPRGDIRILDKRAAEIADAIENGNMFAVGHTSWWFDLGSTYETIRRGWIEEGKMCIDTAKRLGIRLLNFHAFSPGMFLKEKKDRNLVMRNMADSLGILRSYARLSGITIMLENIPMESGIGDPKDMKWILDRSGVLFHMDIGHAFIDGGKGNISRFLKLLGDRTAHVHIHDNNGEMDEHLPIGKGKIDFEWFFKNMKSAGYNGTMGLEVYTSQKDMAKSLKSARKMWELA